MPIYVAVPGDTVSVQLWAQTGSNDLAAYGANLIFDTSKLAFLSVAHPLYTTVLTNNAITNAFNITASGGSGSSVIGWFLASTIYFSVLSSAAGAILSMNCPAILQNAM